MFNPSQDAQWPIEETIGLEQQPDPLTALKAFQKAARELNRVWREAEEQQLEGVLEAGYPFPVAFDKVVGQIDQWIEANQ